jgi:hypothetical protein
VDRRVIVRSLCPRREAQPRRSEGRQRDVSRALAVTSAGAVLLVWGPVVAKTLGASDKRD